MGYGVRHKSQLKGGRTVASFWKYGVELEYLENDGSYIKLFLCRACHLKCQPKDARVVNGTAHLIARPFNSKKTGSGEASLIVSYSSFKSL